MSLGTYATFTGALLIIAGVLIRAEPDEPSGLGGKCGTAHHHACADGLACVRHRCVASCTGALGSDCAPTPELAR